MYPGAEQGWDAAEANEQHRCLPSNEETGALTSRVTDRVLIERLARLTSQPVFLRNCSYYHNYRQ